MSFFIRNLPTEVEQKLNEEAKKLGVSRNALIRAILISYVTRQERIKFEVEGKYDKRRT